jgi:hypothetical protein
MSDLIEAQVVSWTSRAGDKMMIGHARYGRLGHIYFRAANVKGDSPRRFF